MSHLCAFIYPGPQDSTADKSPRENDVRLHHADSEMDRRHTRRGKIAKSRLARLRAYTGLNQKPATVNMSVLSMTDIPFEQVNRSNTRAARGVYPNVNELSIALDGREVKIDKIRKTPRQLRILFRAINRGRLQKFDTSYLVDEATGYLEEEELPPRNYNRDYDDDWSYDGGYDGGYSCSCEYCRW
jgi:Asp-tRNA(Asn)/Glu-tRNA(Gln) amidotransferase B subunit